MQAEGYVWRELPSALKFSDRRPKVTYVQRHPIQLVATKRVESMKGWQIKDASAKSAKSEFHKFCNLRRSNIGIGFIHEAKALVKEFPHENARTKNGLIGNTKGADITASSLR